MPIPTSKEPQKTAEELVYEAYLSSKLNIVERGTAKISGLDERIDFTNLMLLKIFVALSSTYENNTPQWAQELLTAINGLTTSLGGSPTSTNANSIITHRTKVNIPGQAIQLPNVPVPNGYSIAIKSPTDNTDYVYIGGTKSDAEDHNSAYILSPGEVISYQVANGNAIWVDVEIADECVNWTVEQR